MKLSGALILLNAVLVQGRSRRAAEVSDGMYAAEREVAAHMDEVIERAKAVDGWDIDEVVSKVDAGVSKILDVHDIDDVTKETAMDHVNNKLTQVLEKISATKELSSVASYEDEEMEAAELYAAESEVAAHMDAVIERAKAVDGWVIEEVVSKVDAGVSKILDAHDIDDVMKEAAMDHLDNKLIHVLEEISAAKELNPVSSFEHEELVAAESEITDFMKSLVADAADNSGWSIDDVLAKADLGVSEILDEHGFDDEVKEPAIVHVNTRLYKILKALPTVNLAPVTPPNGGLDAAESEVAAHMDEVIERAKATDGWDINEVVSKVEMGVSKILDAHDIDDVTKENAMDHLDDKLIQVLDEISAAKELTPVARDEHEELKGAVSDGMYAAESEVAAHMDEVIERAKATDGWDINEVVSKVEMGVSKILDAHDIDDETKENAMDHLEFKLIQKLEEISAAKELTPLATDEHEELKGAVSDAMYAAEREVAAYMGEVIEHAKATDGWDINEVVSKVDESIYKIMDAHDIDEETKEKAMNRFNNKLLEMLAQIKSQKESKEEEVSVDPLHAAEVEVASHLNEVVERAKATDGWDINDVVSKVSVGVSKILDAHDVDDVMKEAALDHFDKKLSKVLAQISLEKELDF